MDNNKLDSKVMENYGKLRHKQKCLDDSSSSCSSPDYNHSDAPYLSDDGEEDSKFNQEESFRINESYQQHQNNSYADFKDPNESCIAEKVNNYF